MSQITTQRKIQTPSLDFSQWPEIPYRWMVEGLIQVIDKVEGESANYLVALGLICYTEVVGHEIRKFRNLSYGSGYSQDSFDTFLGEYMGYKDLLDKYPVYDWYRCGLTHEFKIKNVDGGIKTGPFHYFDGTRDEAQMLQELFGVDVSKGIAIASNGVRLFLIEPCLHDFVSGIGKFLKESSQLTTSR